MIEMNYSDFSLNLEYNLDCVENDGEILKVKSTSGRGVVIMPLSEYNSMKETLHLLKSRANADRLFESISQMKTRN